MMLGSLMLAAAALSASPEEMTIPGPAGPLAGSFVAAGEQAPAIVVIPGSGPTDRDGNNPLGVTAAPYRLLAEALATKGVATLRIDKRGMFGSRAAVADGNAVTIADYAADVRGWAAALAKRAGRPCVWLLGHSEGGLVALAAAQDARGICGVIVVAGPGRKVGATMRDQLRANPANAPILAPALAAIDALERGERVDAATLPAPLQPLFNAGVQGYLIDLFAQDPARLVAALTIPLLVVQGDRDIQVAVDDAKLLAAARTGSTLAIVPGVNHVLKAAPEDRAGNAATYRDASLPIAPGVVDAVATFVTRGRPVEGRARR